MPDNQDLVLSISDFLSSEQKHREILEDTESWERIPWLNHREIQPDGRLVRFTGMIQDMHDPEFFLESYNVKTETGQRIQNGIFYDLLQFNPETESVDLMSGEHKHGERRSLFVVTIPGLNSWAEEGNQEAVKLPEVEKLQVSKRPEESSSESVKRQKTSESTEPSQASSACLSSEYLINSPLSDRPGRACLVKIYKDFDKFRLNTVIDVIGFLSVHPSLDGSTEDVEEMLSPEEHLVKNPPPSLIPRLHAVSVRESSIYLKEIFPEDDFQEISRDILMLLTQCTFGDQLAGRYLFAHLLSSVQSRVGLEILGKMCLNLSNIPGISSGYTKSLYTVLQELVPVSYRFEMTIENLNEKQFTPKKDYKTGKLTSGILQLAPKTHLILDETHLDAGQLQSSGIEALKSLGNLIRHQSIPADFQFYNLEYEMDVSVLILSEGKSLLPSDVLLPVKVDTAALEHIEETIKAAQQFIKIRSTAIRNFLAAQKLAKFDLDEELQGVIQEDLVSMRKARNALPEELHSLLTLSRLVGKSLGKTRLDRETWDLVKKMDEERRSRLQVK
ncbi:Mini-chromosome maintenance complex-binding protein [Sergentomyia squamirostris]